MPIQQMLLGVGAVATKTYVDDIFSTYVYTGTGSARSINTGIDMTEGGLVWIKDRSAAYNHSIQDTVRGAGATKKLSSNLSNAENSGDTANHWAGYISSFNNNGFSIDKTGSGAIDWANYNKSGDDYTSWTFRKAPGLFDVVTFNETGAPHSDFTVSHSLGCIPGMIILKRTDGSSDWWVWHKYDPTGLLRLNTTAANTDMTNDWCIPTSTNFTFRPTYVGAMGAASWVAYLFAGGESTAATARSVDFDGTGDYLSFAASNDFHLSGDFTIECWVKPEDNANEHIFALGSYGTDEGVLCYIYSDKLYVKTTGTNDLIVADPGPPIGQWTHVAVVRSGSTVNVYLNGTLTKSYTYNTGWGSNSNKTFYIGGSHPGSQFFDGKISNFRVVKGTAVYTSSFKPPTEPLTNITNTKLLCCNNSSTTGSTVTPGTITANGDPTASTDSPFDDPAGFAFGDAGDQGIIKCGSYVGNGEATGPEIDLGWEPQWVMVKNADTASRDWVIWDSMRGIVTGGNDPRLKANETEVEGENNAIDLTPTGFKIVNNAANWNESGDTIIYMAIRRPDGYVGKPPELGTDVFAMDTGNSSESIPVFDSGFPVDFAFMRIFAGSQEWYTSARLISGKRVWTQSNAAEASLDGMTFDSNSGWASKGTTYSWGNTYQSWMWKRHAGFDCITFKGDSEFKRDIPHSLSKIPEMIIVKRRDTSDPWTVYHKGLDGGTSPQEKYLILNDTDAEADSINRWSDTAPTSVAFTVGNSGAVNGDGSDYLAMLFASVDGISKVGYYTGDGSTDGSNAITVGFQPRFLIIKRTDSTGNWNQFDTVRGLGSGVNTMSLNLNTDDHQSNQGSGKIGLSSTAFIPGSGGEAGWNGNNEKYIYYCHA